MAGFDPRVTPWREDLAAASLLGQIPAPRYVEGRTMRVRAGAAGLRRRPRGDEGLETELLFGEAFKVYDAREGWSWGQSAVDAYVGYVPSEALVDDPGGHPSHIVRVPRTLVFPAPDPKLTPILGLSLGAAVEVVAEAARFCRLRDGGFVPADHLAPAQTREPDAAATAGLFLHVPYLFGGRTSAGLDCSALVQLALARAGLAVPRDADQQERAIGEPVAAWESEGLRRGDLVFWEGHVAMMVDAHHLIHANAFHMAVVCEPFDEARARIAAAGLAITAVRRVFT